MNCAVSEEGWISFSVVHYAVYKTVREMEVLRGGRYDC